jgi:predicted transcriptional regulator
MSTGSRDDMSESEIAMRKFLKQLGVTAHQELESALQAAVADGRIKAGDSVPVSATVTIDHLGISHQVDAMLQAPGDDG